MTIEELIGYMETNKIAEADYFDKDEHTQEAYDRVNDHVDECIRLVRDFQSENSLLHNKIKAVKSLLGQILDDAPSDERLAQAYRYDLIEMYTDMQNLLDALVIVDKAESNQEKLFNIINISRRITVTDNWYPCVDGNKVDVQLSIFYYPSKHGSYCVKLCAWGGDDTGVEQEFSFFDLPSALNKFDELEDLFYSIPDGVDRLWFIKHGFDHA